MLGVELHELKMESLKSTFIHSSPLIPPPKPRFKNHKAPPPRTVLCCLQPDPWSLSSGNPRNLNKPKPKSKNPKNPLSDDNARRIIKGKAQYLSVLRRNQGSRAQTPKWIKRTPEQMVRYLEDDRNGHLYGRHVVAAIKCVRSTSEMRDGEYDMREVMGSFVTKLSFREMCVVLKEQKSWRQVRDFFGWMKLQLSYRPSVIAYTLVLRAYGQAGKVKLAEETFLEMLEVGSEPDEVACGTMLCTYARWGRHKAMLTFFSAVEERGIVLPTAVFNFMVSSLQKKSRHNDVVYVWRKMVNKGVAPNHFTYTVVISSLVKSDMADEAFKTFNEMKNLGFMPEESTYSLLICLSSKTGDKDKALFLYNDMRSVRIVPSNFTCASLLALYYRTSDYSKACSLFTEMVRYGVIADEVIYGLMIRIYGKLGLYDDAQKTFLEIGRSSQPRDEKTYTTMAQVHLKFGNFNKALDIMEQMKSNNIQCSRFSYIVLLQCYVVKGDLSSAEDAYQELSKTGLPDAMSCKDMLNLYLRLGQSEKAISFAAKIRKDQVKFDEVLILTILKIYCKGGMLREVEQLLEESRVNFESPLVQTFVMVMNGHYNRLVENENWSEPLDQSGVAIELVLTLCLATQNETKMKEKLEILLRSKVGESVANRMIGKLAKDGDMTVKDLYEIMLKLECRLEDASKASMISMYGKKKKLKQAQEVFATVADSTTNGKVIYGSMVAAYIECNREVDAYLFYMEQTSKGHMFSPVSISILVKALTSCGKYFQAEEVIRHSFHENLELDTIAYNTCIQTMLEAGKLHFAVSIYERMLSLNISPSIQTYNTMISVYGRGRNLDKTVEMFNMAQGVGEAMDEKIYTNMICHYGKAGKVHEASALFSKMQEEGIRPGLVSNNIMISIYADAGLYNEAENLLLSMRKIGCSPDSLTYQAIIRAYTNSSKFAEAEGAILSMQKEGISPTCGHFNLLLAAFTRTGLMKEADRIYRKISSSGSYPNLESKSLLLRGYLNFGLVEEGIYFFERECSSVGRDRFVLSAAIHLYKSASNESQAEVLLNTMKNLGVPFLNNLEVGSKTKTR